MKQLSVAILCGGLSRRLGTDKALVALAPSGTPLIASVIDRVQPLADDLFLVGAARPGYDQFGLPVITDEQPGLGPLGGIATALHVAKHHDCLVVACDMPFLSRPLLEHMAGQTRTDYDVLVPVVPRDLAAPTGPQVKQPLHAIYRRTCLPAIAGQLAAGERRVTGFYGNVRVQVITAEEAKRFDPKLRSFFSVNTPAALDQARQWVAGSSPSR